MTRAPCAGDTWLPTGWEKGEEAEAPAHVQCLPLPRSTWTQPWLLPTCGYFAAMSGLAVRASRVCVTPSTVMETVSGVVGASVSTGPPQLPPKTTSMSSWMPMRICGAKP